MKYSVPVKIFLLLALCSLYVPLQAESLSATKNEISPVCERTKEILNKILAVSYKRFCSEVTPNDLNEITFLNLSNLGLKALKLGDFSGMSSLKTLHLHGNQVEVLPDGIFNGLGSLQILTFYNNQIHTLTKKIFKDLTSLISIDFGSNPITRLTKGIFDYNLNIEEILMDCPQLEEIPDSLFIHLDHLQLITVTSAPLSETTPAAFKGVSRIIGLNPEFNLNEFNDWGEE